MKRFWNFEALLFLFGGLKGLRPCLGFFGFGVLREKGLRLLIKTKQGFQMHHEMFVNS
jgi:hypothetical protein